MSPVSYSVISLPAEWDSGKSSILTCPPHALLDHPWGLSCFSPRNRGKIGVTGQDVPSMKGGEFGGEEARTTSKAQASLAGMKGTLRVSILAGRPFLWHRSTAEMPARPWLFPASASYSGVVL